jgi:hypothetical protein
MEVHEQQVGRRHLLGRAGVMTGAALAGAVGLAATPALADDGGGDRGGRVIGAWLVDRVNEPLFGAPTGSVFRGVWTFAPGGVTHYQDLFGVTAEGPITELIPPLMGAWSGDSFRRFRYEMWSQFPLPSPFLARTAGIATVEGDTISTTYRNDFYATVDGPSVFSFGGELTGRRLSPSG